MVRASWNALDAAQSIPMQHRAWTESFVQAAGEADRLHVFVASMPPGAAGRVYGFVYSGLDIGVLATPMLYGMLIDSGAPQAVFYTIFAFAVGAILTVLQVPGRGRRAVAVSKP